MRLRTFALAGIAAVLPSLAAAQTAQVGASKLLTATPQAFLETCRADIERARASAAQFRTADGGDWAAALDRYDTAVGLLADAASRASLARNVHPDEPMRNAASDCESDVDKAATELSLDRPTYDALTRLNVSGADAATRHYVEKTRRDFRRAGVDKDEATRARVKALREELVKLGQQFQANISSDVRTIELDPAELDGLPEDFKRAHPVNGHGKVALTTNNTDYQPFLSYAKSAKAREEFWKIYRMRGASEEPAGARPHARGAQGAGEPARLPDVGRLHHRRQDDRHAPGGKRLHSEDRQRGRRSPHRGLQGAARAQTAPDAGRDGGRRLGQRLPPGAGEGRTVQVRLAVGAPVLRIPARQAGRDGSHEPDVRHHVPRGARRGGVASGCRDVRRARGLAAARPHLPRHVPARQQVQALRPVHADQRQGEPHPARRRAGLQFPEACRIGTGADAALRRRDVLPRVRPPAAPRPRRQHALGRHLGRGDRMGLRRSAVADAGRVGLDARDAADLRPPLPDQRADPGRTGRSG